MPTPAVDHASGLVDFVHGLGKGAGRHERARTADATQKPHALENEVGLAKTACALSRLIASDDEQLKEVEGVVFEAKAEREACSFGPAGTVVEQPGDEGLPVGEHQQCGIGVARTWSSIGGGHASAAVSVGWSWGSPTVGLPSPWVSVSGAGAGPTVGVAMSGTGAGPSVGVSPRSSASKASP